MVSEASSTVDSYNDESSLKSLMNAQMIADITNHDYEVWNAAYDRGYKSGRDAEARMHSGLELSPSELQAFKKFVMSIGYISHDEHEDFHRLIRRLEDF